MIANVGLLRQEGTPAPHMIETSNPGDLGISVQNIGSSGRSLVEDLILEIRKKFRAILLHAILHRPGPKIRYMLLNLKAHL